MIWSKIRIQLISNNNTLCGIMILRRSSEKKKIKFCPGWPNKDTRDLTLMWKCYPPMYFSDHIMVHILQKQMVWPQANTIFFSSWKQRLVCKPRKARDSTTPGDKTRTRSLFTAVISFSLAAVCTLDHGDLQCYHFISIWSKIDYFSGREHVLSVSTVSQWDPEEKCFQTGLVNTTPRKRKLLRITMNLKTAGVLWPTRWPMK